jgi:acetylornithine deacetylase/succinyl-diaminopimelate desuccinylase-like protein
MLPQFKKWWDQNRHQIQNDYFDFLRFKSISTDPSFESEVRRCSAWVRDYLEKKVGWKAELIETEGYPLVYAENLQAGPQAKTVVIYGHYDVQPVDPLELWKSDPFEPTIRDGKVYARGAVDDKGQIFYAMLAARAWKELGVKLPVNVKFCIEGEEESSSIGLTKALPRLKEKLKGDAILIVDFDQFDPETPAISLGARGLVALEVVLTGSKGDLHSGIHGGMAYNPNRALAELLAKLWDHTGRVQVPGFYDAVVEANEKYDFRYNQEAYTKEFGVEAFGGEQQLSLAERNGLRPTLEINGMGGGYWGAGFKTVIPAKAMAKISARLVPNQDPEKVAKNLSDFLRNHVTKGIHIEVKRLGGEPAFRSSPDTWLAKAIAMAATEVMQRPCKNIVSGGSIPVVAKMIRELGADVVGMGYGLPTDDIHAPNEHFDLGRMERGFLTVARALV